MIDNEQSPIKYFKTRSNPSWELQSWKWDVLTFFFFFSFCPLYLRRIPRAVERRGRGKGRRRGRGKERKREEKRREERMTVREKERYRKCQQENRSH